MLPRFNDDMVNFSSSEYSTNKDRTQCKTKKTLEELKISLAMAKQQASARDVIAKLTKNSNTTPTFEDLLVPTNVPNMTPVPSQFIRAQCQGGDHQPAQICPKDLIRPLEVSNLSKPSSPFQATGSDMANSSSPLHTEILRPRIVYSSSTVSDVTNSPSPLHAGTVQQGSQFLSLTGSDGTNQSTPLHETGRRGRQYSNSTESDVNSENTNPPPLCSECSQHPGKILEYWCDQDQEAICSDCGLIGSHKGHDVSKLEQRNAEAVREILLMVPKVAQVLETLVESKKAIEACPKEEMEKVHDKVSAYFKDQKDELQRKEDVMHLQVKQTQLKLVYDCNDQISEIDKRVKDLRSLLKNADNCLKSKKNIPFIDVNGNILDVRELHQQLKNSSQIPCQFIFEEPVCNINHDGLELNYTKPILRPFDRSNDQTMLHVDSEFEEKSSVKIEDNHDTLVQNNEDLIENLNCSNGNENRSKVVSEIKCQSEDNDICVVTSDDWKVPMQDKIDLYLSNRTGLSKVSMTNSNDARIMERIKKDERSVVLERFSTNVSHRQVANWAERWGKVEDVFKDKNSWRRVIFKKAESATACLAAGKWTFNGAEINVTAPINNYTNSIYCTRLSKTHTTSDLLQYMKKFGTVIEARIHQFEISGDFYAIVSFSSEKERDLSVVYKSHLIKGKIIFVNVYGDRGQFGGRKQSVDYGGRKKSVDYGSRKHSVDYGGRKQSVDYRLRNQYVDTKPQISSTKETPKTLIFLSKSQEVDALNERQEKDLPLSSSTPLETSIVCEVGKASFKNPYAPEVHRTCSGKIVPSNIDSESKSISQVDALLDVYVTSGIIEPVLDPNQVTLTPEKENNSSTNRLCSEKDLDEELYASPAYSEAQLTNDGWVRPVVPTNASLDVKVTHIDASGTVWVVPMEELRAHRLLTKILTNFCEDLISSPDSLTWKPGQRAIVFYEGLHERVEILEVETDRLGSKMTVILVDSGKTIHCRSEELLIAPRSGLPFTYPSLAMPVRLYGIMMNALLNQTHIEKVMGRVRHRKCTLTLAWSPRNFPLPGTVRYTDADCPEGLAQSGNVAEDLMNLGCGELVVSFNDWMYDMSLCDVGWMLDESYFGVDTTKAIPSTLPLRAGLWIPCKAITVDEEVRMVGLLPRVEALGNSTCSLSLSILEDAVNSAHKRFALYGPLAEAENAHLFPTVGENVLVFSDGEWCRARVVETTDDGPWVVLVDYIYQEQVKPEHVRKVPVDGGLEEYWHLDPVHAIRASWPLTGTETQTDIALQKDLLLSSVEYFKVVGFKEIGFDDEKHEVVGHFYDQNKRRLI